MSQYRSNIGLLVLLLFSFTLFGCSVTSRPSHPFPEKSRTNDKLLEKCRKEKNADACFQVASLFADEMDLVYNESIYFYLKKACSMRHANACSLLGVWLLQQGGSCQDIKHSFVTSCQAKGGVSCMWLIYLKEKKIAPSSKSLSCFSNLSNPFANKIMCESKELLKTLQEVFSFALRASKPFLKGVVLREELLSSLKTKSFCHRSYNKDRVLFLFTNVSKRFLSSCVKGPILRFIKEKNEMLRKEGKVFVPDDNDFFTLISSDAKYCEPRLHHPFDIVVR